MSLKDLKGFVIASQSKGILYSSGVGDEKTVQALVKTPAWIKQALAKRLIPIDTQDSRYIGLFAPNDDKYLLLIMDQANDAVMEFLLGVDFSTNILEQILTDPYDAMVVADKEGRLAYLSPVHEKFFGLKHGEAIGSKVTDVIPNSRLADVIKTGVAEVGQVLQMGETQRVTSRHPIRRDGEIVGAIGRVMFKGPQQIEKMSRKISALEKRLAEYERESKSDKIKEKYLDAIIGQSLAIEAVRRQIKKVAALDVPVLIQGESGTGKELVARALHMYSQRSDSNLVTVNAAALPATLVESELFGYEAGAFTGAHRKGRPGKFEQADGGTIFLDEIGDMPLEVQSKLLRVLQERIVERVGGEKPKSVDFRLCSATNHNLEDLVEENKFRLDLFYRISPVCITLPSLEERKEDIPLLLRHFMQEMAEKYDKANVEVESNVVDYLMSRRWPGNIRQLRHEVERAFVFAENGILRIEDFGGDAGGSRSFGASTQNRNTRLTGNGMTEGTIKEATARVELEMISDCMVRFRGNKKKVADHLGISRSYLYKKLEELNIHDD